MTRTRERGLFQEENFNDLTIFEKWPTLKTSSSGRCSLPLPPSCGRTTPCGPSSCPSSTNNTRSNRSFCRKSTRCCSRRCWWPLPSRASPALSACRWSRSSARRRPPPPRKSRPDW